MKVLQTDRTVGQSEDPQIHIIFKCVFRDFLNTVLLVVTVTLAHVIINVSTGTIAKIY